PYALCEVLGVNRAAVTVPENPLDVSRGRLALGQHGLLDRWQHGDLAAGVIGLGPLADFAIDERLANQDQVAIKIDVAPAQAVDLPGAHAGEESHHEVVPVIG